MCAFIIPFSLSSLTSIFVCLVIDRRENSISKSLGRSNLLIEFDGQLARLLSETSSEYHLRSTVRRVDSTGFLLSETTRPPPILIDQSSNFDASLHTSTFEDSTIFTEEDDRPSTTTKTTTSRTRTTKRPRTTPTSSSVLHEKNFLPFLSFITTLCAAMISSSVVYGFWSIRKHSYSLWATAVDSRIRFLFRRSIRSSNRSNPKIATIAQILDDLDRIDHRQQEQEPSNHSLTPSSDLSLANVSYYTYL